MSKRTTRPQSPESSPLLSETADLERGRARGAFSGPDDAKHWDAVPPPATTRRGQGSRVFRSVMLVLIAILAVLLLGVRRQMMTTAYTPCQDNMSPSLLLLLLYRRSHMQSAC